MSLSVFFILALKLWVIGVTTPTLRAPRVWDVNITKLVRPCDSCWCGLVMTAGTLIGMRFARILAVYTVVCRMHFDWTVPEQTHSVWTIWWKRWFGINLELCSGMVCVDLFVFHIWMNMIREDTFPRFLCGSRVFWRLVASVQLCCYSYVV